MKRILLALILMIFLLVLSIPFCIGADLYSKYLTVADVEKATGFKNVTVKNVAVNLEFYRSDGAKFLEVEFGNASLYATETKNPKYYAPVPGIAEKAAIALPQIPYRLALLKGKSCVLIQTFRNIQKRYILNKDQLIAVAKIVAAKIK